jgi:hypothetical protein
VIPGSLDGHLEIFSHDGNITALQFVTADLAYDVYYRVISVIETDVGIQR